MIAWLGFFGSWLLVAGPAYQGVLELRAQAIDQDSIKHAADNLTPPPPPSAWWWLLPPVMLWLRRRRNEVFRAEALGQLAAEQRAQFAGFIEKATGWFAVAAGGALLATKETWELRDHYNWPTWAFVTLVVLGLGISIGNAAVRFPREDQHLK